MGGMNSFTITTNQRYNKLNGHWPFGLCLWFHGEITQILLFIAHEHEKHQPLRHGSNIHLSLFSHRKYHASRCVSLQWHTGTRTWFQLKTKNLFQSVLTLINFMSLFHWQISHHHSSRTRSSRNFIISFSRSMTTIKCFFTSPSVAMSSETNKVVIRTIDKKSIILMLLVQDDYFGLKKNRHRHRVILIIRKTILYLRSCTLHSCTMFEHFNRIAMKWRSNSSKYFEVASSYGIHKRIS